MASNPPAPKRKHTRYKGTRMTADGLTPREGNFVRALVRNEGNVTQAALDTYDVTNPRSASSTGSAVLARPRVRQAFEEACAKLDYGPSNVAQIIVNAQFADNVSYSQSGEKRADPDHRTRLQSASLAAKLLDLEPRETGKQDGAKHLHLHGLSRSEMTFLFRMGRLPAPGELEGEGK